MNPLHISTPTLESQALKNKLNKIVYFKLEALQPVTIRKIKMKKGTIGMSYVIISLRNNIISIQ